MTNYELSRQLRLTLCSLECDLRESCSPFEASFLKDAQVIMDKIASTWGDIENIPWTEDEINADEDRYDVSFENNGFSVSYDRGPAPTGV